MRAVYEAENLIDAHLARGVLEQAGIPAWVRGEHLVGAMGELPALGLIAVCVPEALLPVAGEALRPYTEALGGHFPELDPDRGGIAVGPNPGMLTA